MIIIQESHNSSVVVLFFVPMQPWCNVDCQREMKIVLVFFFYDEETGASYYLLLVRSRLRKKKRSFFSAKSCR